VVQRPNARRISNLFHNTLSVKSWTF
jgi:hypothetical protein